MSVAYQPLKAPEKHFDDGTYSDDSIQNSPTLENGPQFDPPATPSIDSPTSPYYQDDEYEDQIYGEPSESTSNGTYQQIEGGNPYYNDTLRSNQSYGGDHFNNFNSRDLSRAKLPPIIEPPSELMPSFTGAEMGDLSNNSFQNEPLTTSKPGPPSSLRTDDMSPHSKLNFDRTRGAPRRSLISPSFRAPSGGTIISEPTRPNDFQANSIYKKSQRRPNNDTENELDDNDGDTLPFDLTTRSATQDMPVNTTRYSDGLNRVMTSNTFENYKRKADVGRESSIRNAVSPSRQNSVSPVHQVDISRSNTRIEHGIPDDSEFEDQDEKQQKKKAAKLRQEQDARMSLYRQSMMKIIGTSAGDGDVDGLSKSSQALNVSKRISVDQDDNDDDDDDLLDDIPLSILQAHRFPKGTHSRTPAPQTPTSHSREDLSVIGRQSVNSEPLRSEVGVRASIASSRMLPNVESTHRRPPGAPGTPGASLSHIFGNKDSMLSRGLIGEISREEDMRRRRHTIGYGVDLSNNTQTTHTIAPKLSESIKDEGLQDKLDLVIQMLAKLTPQNSPLPAANPSMTNPGIHQRAPSIYSTLSHDNYLSPQQTPHNFASPGNFGIGQFSPVPFPPPSLPNTFIPESATNPNGSSSFFQRPMSYTAGNSGLNRPSQMRTVNGPVNDDDYDDEAQMQKLKEEREKLKEKWIKKSEVPEAENPQNQEDEIVDESFDFKDHVSRDVQRSNSGAGTITE